MKTIIYSILYVCMMSAMILHTGCTSYDEQPETGEGRTVYLPIHVGVSNMTMSETSRASSPMTPELETYIKTMAIFEFDNEGLHIKNEKTYHFVDFIKGTIDGERHIGVIDTTKYGIVETTLNGIALEERSNGTLCFVANVTEIQVDSFYKHMSEPGQSYERATLDQFKKWSLTFHYEQADEGVYDETHAGHVEEMYMFGYYEGPIDPATSAGLWVDLGRLASRIDLTIVNKTGDRIKKRLGYHFDNVCHSSYFFPIKQSVPPTINAGLSRTVICSGEGWPVDGDRSNVPQTFANDSSHTRYFYVAAHSAKDINDATKIHLFYDRAIVNDDVTDNTNSVKIPLCNIHPSEAASVTNGYSLSRNTRYHFTINLMKKDRIEESRAASASQVEYGDRPGEINVYLP